MKDHEVVEAFVAHLAVNGYPGLGVDKWPERENRRSKDIEAIAGPFAIEHTSIDTLPNQRGKSDWFMRVTGGLEKEIPKPPYRLNIALEYDAIDVGQNWTAIREALKTWIIEDCPQLSDGCHNLDNIPGVPFRLRVKKASDRPPRIIFSRIAPEDESLPGRIRKHLEEKEKIRKLEPYKARGLITVLLIESCDIALMNWDIMFEALRKAFPEGIPLGIDMVWYIDTSIPSELEFKDFTDRLKKQNA